MTRYCKQQDRSSCGPIALVNLFKFLGVKSKFADKSYLRKLMNCDQFGCTEEAFDSTLRGPWGLYDVVLKKEGRVKLKALDRWLDQGRPIIMRFFHEIYHGRRMGHFITIVGRTKKGYLVANYGSKHPALTEVPRMTISRSMRMKRKKNGDQCLTYWIRKT